MMLTVFEEKLKVVSSDFSMMKNIVTLLFSSSLPKKKFVVLDQGFLIQFVCSNLLQLIYNDLKCNHNKLPVV